MTTTASGTTTAVTTMADRRRPTLLRGTSIPARWRIVGLILLTTSVTLVAVAIAARILLLGDVDRRANSDVAQEISEFRAFAAQGVDPATTQPFASVERLLSVFLARQHPSDGEEILGLTGGSVLTGGPAGAALEPPYPEQPYSVGADPTLLERIRASASPSGVVETPIGPMRWGKVSVDAGTEQGELVVAVFTEGRRALVNDAIRKAFYVAAAGLLCTAGIAWLVAGRILAPVRAVREVAADIGESDLAARVPVQGRDDIAALAATFNAMLDRIEHAYLTQRRFVDDASHELRTPITVIRGHLELMGSDPDERSETLRLVDEELARMTRIVSDLLTLAKAERPDFVQRGAVDVAELTLHIEAKAHALGDREWLIMQVADGVAWIDGQRITQAVLQLATNAVQYTRVGDTVRLGSAFAGVGADRRLTFWVSDTGPGIRASEAETIFDRFQHGSAHWTQLTTGGPVPERSGAGLGLAIVRAIAEAHGGSPSVRSELGEGATFAVDIPVPEHRADAGDTVRIDRSGGSQ